VGEFQVLGDLASPQVWKKRVGELVAVYPRRSETHPLQGPGDLLQIPKSGVPQTRGLHSSRDGTLEED